MNEARKEQSSIEGHCLFRVTLTEKVAACTDRRRL